MSNEVTICGVVHVIEDTKAIGAKGFKKRTIVIEADGGRFTNYIPVELAGEDACNAADSLTIGADFEAKCKVGGRKWQKDPGARMQYFLSLETFSFISSAAEATKSQDEPAASSVASGGYDMDDSSIPF